MSKFKASCTALVRRVKRTRKPVRITRFGEAMADLVPSSGPPKGKRWLGSMAGTAQIHGDIVAPAFDEGEWEALADEIVAGYTHLGVEPKRSASTGAARRPRSRRR